MKRATKREPKFNRPGVLGPAIMLAGVIAIGGIFSGFTGTRIAGGIAAILGVLALLAILSRFKSENL